MPRETGKKRYLSMELAHRIKPKRFRLYLRLLIMKEQLSENHLCGEAG